MESKTHYTLVGIFVVILTMAIVIFITWLSTGFSTKQYKDYLVIMNESVPGLAINSSVKYNGVNVGNVKKIYLNKAKPKEVRLLLQIEAHVPITAGTTATLNSQGLTGITYVDLQGSNTNLDPPIIPPDEHYPVIKSIPSLFLRLNTTLHDLTTNINQITQDINGVLGGNNPLLFKQILQNLNITTQHLSAQSKEIDSILMNTSKLAQAFPLLTNTLAQQTLPSANEVLNNLTMLSSNLLEFSENLKQNPAILLRGQQPLPLGPGEK